jgi:hypothetical protein
MKRMSFIIAVTVFLMGIFHATAAAEDLSVKQWTGHAFIILPKQKIASGFGYELYLSPRLDLCKSMPDTGRETKSRRVRCDKFGGSTVVVRDVKASGKEFLVRFIHEPTGISLYGRTRGGAIEGLARAGDLSEAKRRGLGKTVYSTGRFINLYDSATGDVTTRKVRITDPLAVVDVQWGTTPLPPQPLWLIVETAGKARGFIPVRASRTNVMSEMKKPGNPWDDDVLEQDPRKVYSWDNVVWEAIDNHSILPRMTKSQVRLSWGPPKNVRRESGENANGEHWIFDNEQDLYFTGDTLVSIDGR